MKKIFSSKRKYAAMVTEQRKQRKKQQQPTPSCEKPVKSRQEQREISLLGF